MTKHGIVSQFLYLQLSYFRNMQYWIIYLVLNSTAVHGTFLPVMGVTWCFKCIIDPDWSEQKINEVHTFKTDNTAYNCNDVIATVSYNIEVKCTSLNVLKQSAFKYLYMFC